LELVADLPIEVRCQLKTPILPGTIGSDRMYGDRSLQLVQKQSTLLTSLRRIGTMDSVSQFSHGQRADDDRHVADTDGLAKRMRVFEIRANIAESAQIEVGT
jgi:hypothetical protein